MAGKGSENKRHGRPTTAEHFSPQIERRIDHRAMRNLTMAGIPTDQAKQILKAGNKLRA